MNYGTSILWRTTEQPKGTDGPHLSMDESQKHAKWKKSDTQGYTLLHNMYVKFQIRQN